MRTFLLGGHPHWKGISRIFYLSDLSTSSLYQKMKHCTYIYIYTLKYDYHDSYFNHDSHLNHDSHI